MTADIFTAIDSQFPAAVGGPTAGDGWRLLGGDCLEILPRLPAASVDLIFADPPYNLQLKGELYRPNNTRVDGVDDDWDKFESLAAYEAFCDSWLCECRRVLRADGTIWIIGSYHNIYLVGALLMKRGFWILNNVIWHKSNPMPNFRGVRFTNATEELIWAKKSADKGGYVFNYAAMKEMNGGKQMTNVWRMPLCGGGERLRDSSGAKRHPTQKPAELMRRVILSSTREGGVILDPFAGSGTTLAVARRHNRRAVGIEKEAAYLDLCAARVAAISQSELNFRQEAAAASPPSLPPRKRGGLRRGRKAAAATTITQPSRAEAAASPSLPPRKRGGLRGGRKAAAATTITQSSRAEAAAAG